MNDKKKGSILIVDDNRDVLKAATLLLKPHLERIVTATDPMALNTLLVSDRFDVILLDMNFTQDVTSGAEGLHFLRQIKAMAPATVVILFTAYGDVDLAVRSIKEGASDFVLKPWNNEKLLATVLSALELGHSRQRIEHLSAQNRQLISDHQGQTHTLIGSSPVIKQTLTTIGKVAATDANILINGANGTGKELVARAIHRQSQRAEEAFIGIDMGAISETLFESELFGHERGAFTDAKQARAGRFEIASGGTLFLDEIGNLPLHLQAKILRVLETREVQRLGSHRAIPIDIRLICATNMNLAAMVRSGTFREDLLYRINTVEIALPPLRDRLEDLPELTDFFIDLYQKKYKINRKGMTPQALEKLRSHSWPGNIRELKHAIERALIFSEGEQLQAADFFFKVPDREPQAEPLLGDVQNLEEVEKSVITKVLRQHGGNISKAAEALGLTRASLYRRMEKHGL